MKRALMHSEPRPTRCRHGGAGSGDVNAYPADIGMD